MQRNFGRVGHTETGNRPEPFQASLARGTETTACELAQIAGHAGDTGDKYGARIPADVLRDDINRIEFRSVQWDPVVRSARLRVERMIDRYGVRP